MTTIVSVSQRRPRSVYEAGAEPDPRFSMANERTALAWVRTSLALVAAGVGLTSLARLADLAPALDGLAALMCLLGAGLAGNAMLGWRRRELAMRTGQPLPSPAGLFWLVAGIIVVALVLAVYVALAG